MPTEFAPALRDELAPKRVAVFVALLAAAHLVVGLAQLEVVFVAAAGLVGAVRNAAVEASLIDPRLEGVVLGLALAALGVSGVWFGPDATRTVVLAGAAVAVGGWLALDALTARWAGLAPPDRPGADSLRSERSKNAALPYEVYAVIRTTDGPLSTAAVAEACGLPPSRAEKAIDAAVSHGLIVETAEGYVATDIYGSRLSRLRATARRLLARLARPFVLLGSSRHA